jgi:hypothetical protein
MKGLFLLLLLFIGYSTCYLLSLPSDVQCITFYDYYEGMEIDLPLVYPDDNVTVSFHFLLKENVEEKSRVYCYKISTKE